MYNRCELAGFFAFRKKALQASVKHSFNYQIINQIKTIFTLNIYTMNYLITGKQGAGKTKRALTMSQKYIIIDGSDANIKQLRDDGTFLFQDANIDTSHIIIETNANILEKYETTFRCLLRYDKILINKKGKEPFYISPTFILISQTFVDVADKRDLEHIHCA